MGRERFEDLKGAYALDSLPEEERLEFERYLAEHPSEQAEVEELSSVAALLALAPPEQEPPAGLRRSLMGQVRSEAGPDGAGVRPGTGRSHRGGWMRRVLGARGAAVAAAAVAIVGLLVWNISLQSEVRDLRDYQISSHQLQGTGEADSARGQVVGIGQDKAMLVVTDLPDLPEGQTYEMWTIDGNDNPEPSGLFRPGEGPEIETLQSSISRADEFAITVEPKGGSQQPTGDIIVRADLTRA